MGIIAAGQITVVDLSDAPVLNAFITASRPTTQTYSNDSRDYNPSYASTPQVLTLNVTKSGSTTSIIDSIRGLQWFVVDGSVKTEITSKDNASNEYISGNYNEKVTTKLNIDTIKGYRCYEATGVWRDPSTNLDVQFTADINLLLTQNGATGPQGPQGDKGETGNGIANTVVTYGLSMSDTTEPATWSSERPALVKGMYLWIRTVIIYTNGESTTSYQISYIPKDGDASGEIDKTKQELLEKLETVRDDSLAAVEEAKEQLETVRNDSLAAAEEAKQQVTTVAGELNTAKQDFQNAVSAVDTKATNVQNDLSQAKQDLASQAQKLQEQANAQSELTNRVSSVEETANGTKTTVSELSKTVDQNGKDITSVTARTKVVEDDLSGTKTTLSQVKMTADSTSQKTATLETGLSGLSAKFNSLSVGNKNYLPASRVVNRGCTNFSYSNTTKSWTMTVPASSTAFGNGIRFNTNDLNILLNGGETLFFGLMIKANKACSFNYDVNNALSGTTSNDNDDTSKRTHYPSNKNIPANVWMKVWFSYTAKANVPITEYNSNFGIVNNTEPVTVEIKEVMVAKSNIPVDYQTPDAELEQKIAEYKQTADQNYASLQTTVQNLDGTVQHNKTVADQTAQGFSTRIESLETYKDEETTRANKYFELAKNETARQLTVERTAIAKDYVAKSTYTSDVTGIRNELSATTTTANTIKTNLANYQATNDRAVASLQSSMQTANGNISSLKTKVEAVPGQITSAVSAVESKIPTGIGSSNLLRSTAVNADNLKLFDKSNSTISVVTKDGHQTYKIVVSANGSGVFFNGNSLYYSLIKDRSYTFSFWVLTNKDKSYGFHSLGHIQAVNSNGDIVGSDILHQHTTPVYSTNTIKANTWTKVWCTFKATSNSYFKPYFWYLNSGDEIYIYDMMLNEGNIPLSYTPAIEDTQSDITTLNTTLTQTANGLKQLSTQVTSQGGTITSHTNSISALTTGLQAKVSQSDFNTLSGRVTTAENNIIAKANELSSKITSVEGKIPTSVGGRNYIKDSEYRKANIYVNDNQVQDEAFNISSAFWQNSNVYAKKIKLSLYYQPSVAYSTERKFSVYFRKSPWPWIGEVTYPANTTRLIKYTIRMTNGLPANFTADQIFIRFDGNLDKGRYHNISKVMLEVSDVFSDWQPAPEDAIEEISSLSSELKQTQNGITLLATKTELNTAKNELQSGIKTATDKANSNAQTITTHTSQISALNNGLSAKVSQSDFNKLSGRVTTAENNITAKANELSSKISSVEGKLPSGEINLVAYGRPADGYSPYAGAEYTTHEFYYNSAYKMYIIRNSATSEKMFGMNRFKVERNTDYTLYFKGFNNGNLTNMDVWFLKRVNGSNNGWDSAQQLVNGRKLSVSRAEDISVTFNTGNYDEGYIRFDNNGTTKAGTSADLYFGDVSVKKGKSNNGWSPSLAELASSQDLKNAQSEFKQTTNAIKASVSSLDNSTVKSSSLTINSDGIVMKAGKSTTDVANAIGSYFAVNQNAINLFADKIKVKGSMIVSGSISSDKIAASGITANVIKGGTLQSTNGSTNFELNTGKLFYNNNNTGVFRIQNGASTMGLKFSNTPVTVSGTSRILSRVIIGGDRNETSLDDGKWDKGGFSGLVIETIKGAIPAVNEHADSLRAISDTIYFTHTYSADSPTGVSAHGWKMETYAPDSSYSGNIVLKPYGINYRQSDIVVGDIRLDNGDGSGYWMRATINTLKACFGHILNGGTSSQALNAIRSELNKISGT